MKFTLNEPYGAETTRPGWNMVGANQGVASYIKFNPANLAHAVNGLDV